MAAPLDEISVITKEEIYPNALEDQFFLDSPFTAYMRAKALVPFRGGSDDRNVFTYGSLIGGAYERGENFNINKQQTLAGTVFDPRFYQVSIPEFLEDLEVFNKGANAVFKLIDVDTRTAVKTISSVVSVAFHRHGQASGGAIADDRSKHSNGWAEALNDGITSSWDGNEFVNYGAQARNGVVGAALNSIPYWAGTAGGAQNDVSYNTLEKRYQAATRGRIEPDLGVCNKELYASIKERLQVQQRFLSDGRDPYWGFSGLKMNSAMIMKDDYFPSLVYGQNDPVIGNWLTAAFTSSAAPDSTSNMPASTSITPGEIFCWFNTNKWKLLISDSAEFGFGITPFVPAQDNTRVVARIKAALTLECTAPWANQQILGLK